jgi:sugar phosphate isomerase/epimerase
MQPIACSSLTFAGRPLDEALRRIADLGFDHVDLAVYQGWAHVNPADLAADGEAVIAAVLSALARAGLRVNALNVGVGRDLTDPEHDRRLRGVCMLAAALEVQVLTLQTPAAGTPLDEAARRMTRVKAMVEQAGLIPAFETHTKMVTEDPATVLRLVELVPDMRITLDHSHYVFGNVRSHRWVDLLPHTAHVHLRDSGPDGDHVQVEPGTGEVDMAGLLRRLVERGYDGPISLEYIEGMGGVDAAACTIALRRQLEDLIAQAEKAR